MDDSYTIIVFNHTSSPHKYFIFRERPVVTGVEPEQVFVNIMSHSGPTAAGTGTASFVINKSVHAICATVDHESEADMHVTTADSRLVVLGTYNTYASHTSVTVSGKGGASFGVTTQALEKNNPSGGFVLQTNPFDAGNYKPPGSTCAWLVSLLPR